MFNKLFKLLSIVMVIMLSLMVAGCVGTIPQAEAPAPVEEASEASAEEAAEAPAEEVAEETTTGQVPGSETVTVAWTATDPTTMDPAVCNSTDCTTFMRAMYESLVAFKYGTTEIEGVLADSWEVSDDGLNWTFTLRDEVNFADGSSITPEDVVYSFDRLNEIGKGPAFVLGGAYIGAEVVDDKTVTIKLERAIGPFLTMLPRVFILNSKVVQEQATDDDPWAEQWMYDHSAGSGPFIFEEWQHGVQVSAIKNPNYWDPEWPKVERFVTLQVPERATDRLLLEKGEVETVINPVMDIIPDYRANPDLTVEEHESLISMQIMMNMTAPPLDDVRVRKAVALAFDYQAMAEGVYQGNADQAQGPLSRRMLYQNDSLPVYEQDLDQAKELLAEAGYPDGGFDLELLIVQGQPFGIGASQILQQGLAEIGVNLQIIEQPWVQMFGRIQNRDNPAHMYVWYNFPAYPDPDSVLWSNYHSSQIEAGSNNINFDDPEVDALLEIGRFGSDEAEREAAYLELQQRIFDAHPAIWMVNPKNIAVYRSWVKNFKYDPTWHQTYRVDRYILEDKP